MQHHLRVARRRESMSAVLELTALLPVIEHLTVEDDHVSAVRGVDRLMSPAEINDAEPAHAQPDVALDVKPRVVGTPVRDPVGHGPHVRLLRAALAIHVLDTNYAAHVSCRTRPARCAAVMGPPCGCGPTSRAGRRGTRPICRAGRRD